MRETWSTPSDTPLHEEHLLLGGIFDDASTLLAPARYGMEDDARSVADCCMLSDLSGMASILVSGAGASSFVEAACASPALAVGECAFGAVVTGDGSIASIPLIARTGDEEYLVWDATSRGLMLQPWLRFLGQIEQDGYRPFEGVRIEDEGSSLVPLLLWGSQAPTVLADYVPRASDLPEAGHVASVCLDRIVCLASRLPVGGSPCYLVLAPPRTARALWRSFLSFPVVSPLGSEPLARYAHLHVPWFGACRTTERLELGLEQLVAWGLARAEGGYIGHRALLTRQP